MGYAYETPILTYVIAIFLVDEPVLLSRFVGIIVAVTGIALISRAQAANVESNGAIKFDALGIGVSFLAAICWASGSVLLQMGVTNTDPIDANFVRMLFGGAIFIPVFLGLVKGGMPLPTRKATKIVLAAGFFGMTVGTLLYTFTVKLIGAPIAALLGSMSPLFAVPISVFFLKEKFSPKSLVGAVLTVFGVMLVVLAV